MNLADHLHAFSEWLDAEGVSVVPDGDTRTHDDLVAAFLASRPRRVPLDGLDLQVVPGIDTAEYVAHTDRVTTTDLDAADVVTSHVSGSEPETTTLRSWDGLLTTETVTVERRHKPVLDLDVPATLVPSSTPGHSHLYVDVEIEEPTYFALLEALADAGILEPGYVGASLARGYTAARLPWRPKGTGTPAPKPAPLPGVLDDAPDPFAALEASS